MGIEANTAGHYPEIAKTAYVHPNATVIGRVSIGDYAFIAPHAVIRADEMGPDGTIAPIAISECVNVQDCVVIHALGGAGVTIGPRSSIAHAAVIHGPCRIGAGCFVGFNSVVFRATLEDNAVVMHQALVESATIADGLFVPSMTAVCCNEDASRLAFATPDIRVFVERVSSTNVRLARAALAHDS